jgi:hypothetical protein
LLAKQVLSQLSYTPKARCRMQDDECQKVICHLRDAARDAALRLTLR